MKEEYLLDTEKSLSTCVEARDQMERNKQFMHWFVELFQPLMLTIEKAVLLKIYHEFNAYFTEWFSILIDDDMITARLDDTFSPYVEQNGYETSFENLSGGEKTAVALAYRLALNKVINTFMVTITTKDFLILDEPTDGFSTEQLDKMREVLDQLDLKQILIVSHEHKIEAYVEHVLQIVKDGHVSSVLS
jgi:exonuclease SbcC